MAVNPASIARALPKAPTAGQGGFGDSPFTGANLPSPLVASYDQWSYGRTSGTGLPRNPATFLGSFGPLMPMQPVAVDQLNADTGRPDPRRWQYPVSWNIPHGVPGDEGLKLASFANLRVIGDTYSVARACIQLRKDELLGLGWDIVPTKAAEKAMRSDPTARREFEERRTQLMRFFRRPDTNYFSFRDWFAVLLEDVLVIDALSLYLWPPRRSGKGIMGTDLAELVAVDGSTIRPLVDTYGAIPKPPNPGFQQVLFGVPRTDLATIAAGGDIDGIGDDELGRAYRGDQLIYRPQNPRDWTPYGLACIERALIPILSGIQRQQFQLDYFSEGTIPGLFVSAGDANATPNQLRELQDALNAMAGDPAWKHKIIVLPQGSRTDPQRPTELAGTFDEIVMTQVCMAFSVMPMELGISPRTSSSQSSGAANQMAKASQSTHERKANLPMLEWFSDIFNHIIRVVCKQHDMKWWWEGLEEDEDERTKTDIQKNKVTIGLASIDEVRIENGDQPWGLPTTSEPVLITATGVVPFSHVDPSTGQPAGLTPKLTAAPPPPGTIPPGNPPTDGSSGGGGTKPKKPKPKPTGPGGAGGKPGGAPTPAHAAGQQQVRTQPPKPAPTPAPVKAPAKAEKTVNTFAALRELDLLRRRIGKGRSLDTWAPEHVPDHVFTALAADPTPAGLAAARTVVKTMAHRQRRDTATATAQRHIADRLRHLGNRLTDGTLSTPGFIDAAVDTLRVGIHAGLTAGADDARGHNTPVTKGGGTLPDSRYALYTGQVVQAYETAYGLVTIGAADDPDNIVVLWHPRPDACVLCGDRVDVEFTVGTLPGFPGEGSFGELCEGGPRCRCSLEYRRPDVGTAARPTGPAPAPSPTPLQQQTAVTATAVRRALAADNPRPALHAVWARVAEQRAEQQRPYLQGLLQDALTAGVTATVPGTTTVADSAATVAVSIPTVVAAATAIAVAGQEASQGEAAPVTKGRKKRGRHVYDYLAKHYPADTLGWVKDAAWRGPVDVALSDVSMARRPGGARDLDKVEAIAQSVRDGAELDPIVLVDTPDGTQYKVADGFHRTLALDRVGRRTVSAWVGKVDQNTGPWAKEMHEEKLNKAADGTPVAAGLAVRAADTGRVLMLQRAVTDGDPAAGMWEFPGGTLDDGEKPLAAARREWAEETGCHVPDGHLGGMWTSSNGGAYQGFVLTVPTEADVPVFDGRDEVTNPDDPDGDQVEALAWWDPKHLNDDNPCLRAELVADVAAVTRALTAAATVGKVNEGPVGDYRARHLHEYWTRGEGLARWIDSPHKWTALYHGLSEYIHNDDEAKRTAAQWFHDTLGYWPGDQRGKNPVGPG